MRFILREKLIGCENYKYQKYRVTHFNREDFPPCQHDDKFNLFTSYSRSKLSFSLNQLLLNHPRKYTGNFPFIRIAQQSRKVTTFC